MEYKLISSNEDLETAFSIRKEVFVEEQSVPLSDEFDKYDQLDSSCKHILVFYNEQPVGTGRLRVVGEYGKLERICVLQPFRHFGLGKNIVQALEQIAIAKDVAKVKLHGQKQAEGFYHKLGYQTSSNIFMEDGIPHILMTKQLV